MVLLVSVLRLYETTVPEPTPFPTPQLHCDFMVGSQEYECDVKYFDIYANDNECKVRGLAYPDPNHCDFLANCACNLRKLELKFYEGNSSICEGINTFVQVIPPKYGCQKISICEMHNIYWTEFTESHWNTCCGWKCSP